MFFDNYSEMLKNAMDGIKREDIETFMHHMQTGKMFL